MLAPSDRREPIRVVLVDDHALFRSGLGALIAEEGFAVVGEASNGLEGVRLARELAPDVVIMDLNMPGMSGVEATRAASAQAPASRVVILTVSGDEASVTDAVLAGACGYLLKDAAVDDILTALRSAAAGESWISPRVAGALLERVRRAGADRPAAADEPSGADLSDRELEVLRLIAQGKENIEIAAELFISPKTAKNHVSSILAKLQLQNRIQAAVYAVKRGLD
ncbi:MAG: DNA-binding response regulator [Solirubrobacterales bacterium]|nr:DNA-binding response regulator [Solirubrobacterales bacterium]